MTQPTGVQVVWGAKDRLDELEPLWKELADGIVAVTPARYPRLDREESWDRARESIQNWLRHQDAFLLLAKRHGQNIGYAVIGIQKGRNKIYDAPQRRARICDLAVVSAERRQGVATALMDAALQQVHAMGIREVTLAVVAGNQEVQRALARHGFFVDTVEMSMPLS